MKIYYKSKAGFCYTDCPHSMKADTSTEVVAVGSCACIECDYYVEGTDDEVSIECTHLVEGEMR